MAGIGVDSEGLNGAAARVDGIASNFQSEMEALGRLVQETGNYMQGGPQATFEAKYEQFKGTMNNFIVALNAYSSTMRSYAAQSDSNVQNATRTFESI